MPRLFIEKKTEKSLVSLQKPGLWNIGEEKDPCFMLGGGLDLVLD